MLWYAIKYQYELTVQHCCDMSRYVTRQKIPHIFFTYGFSPTCWIGSSRMVAHTDCVFFCFLFFASCFLQCVDVPVPYCIIFIVRGVQVLPGSFNSLWRPGLCYGFDGFVSDILSTCCSSWLMLRFWRFRFWYFEYFLQFPADVAVLTVSFLIFWTLIAVPGGEEDSGDGGLAIRRWRRRGGKRIRQGVQPAALEPRRAGRRDWRPQGRPGALGAQSANHWKIWAGMMQ